MLVVTKVWVAHAQPQGQLLPVGETGRYFSQPANQAFFRLIAGQQMVFLYPKNIAVLIVCLLLLTTVSVWVDTKGANLKLLA